jgi:hypothetical protein
MRDSLRFTPATIVPYILAAFGDKRSFQYSLIIHLGCWLFVGMVPRTIPTATLVIY